MLTEEQALSVQTPDEHKLICALPGSGKTHTFISLVDKILDKKPRYTVCLVTFTNATAKEMSDRVKTRMGREKARRVHVSTFARLMMQQFKPLAGRRKPVIGAQQITLVKRALEKEGERYNDVSDWVSKIEEHGRCLMPENDGTATSRVFAAYCGILDRYNLYDLNMMSRELVSGIESGMLAPYPYSHILCDEFQDTDELQFEWLAVHARAGKKIAVVGDDDQSIYDWRGAMGYHAFTRFQKEFGASGYYLSMCFRCQGNILHSARGLIEHNTDRIHKNMRSKEEGKGAVKLITIPKGYVSAHSRKRLEMDMPSSLSKKLDKDHRDKGKEDSKMERYRFVAQRIQESGLNGWAILARTNKILDKMETALSELQIQTVRIGGASIFDNQHAIGLIALLSGITDRRQLSELITGLGWLGESELQLEHIYERSATYGFVGAQSSEGMEFSKEVGFFQKMANDAQYVTDKQINPFLAQFFRNINSVISHKDEVDAKFQLSISNVIEQLLTGMSGTLTERIQALVLRARNNNRKQDIKNPDTVVLATKNGSKGLEWPRVWIIDVEKGTVPFIRNDTDTPDAEVKSSVEQDADDIKSCPKVESERRLLYVAMTRAEQELYLSFRENRHSTFIEEITGQVTG